MAGIRMAARRCGKAAAAAFLVAAVPTAATAGDHGWGIASSVVRDGLVAAALGVPAVQRDWAGDLQAGAAIVVAGGSAAALKEIFPERRPDGSDDKSFPSGHAAVSFAAAATLENRYGWRAGIPAFVAATFVDVARVQARKHHWYDVLAGSVLGTGSGLLLTRRRDPTVQLVPWMDRRAGGLSVAFAFR